MKKINKFLKDNKKILLFAVFLLVFVSACTSVRNSDGTIDPSKLIYLDTPYMDSISEGWFNIIVWPVAQLINLVAKYLDAGWGIIIVTILINLVTAAMSIKQQVATQKMQMIQPEQQRIQAKYEGKTDQASKMRQAQELQNLYKKHDINPMGSLVTMFIQLPVILAVYQAVMRADSVYKGEFMGVDLTTTPMQGITKGQIAIIIIFALMVIFQFVSLKLPQYLAKKRKENSNIKTKDYANPKDKKGGMQGSMNMMMYMSVGMIVIFAINWPLGMSFYWLVSAFTRIIQNIVIQKFFIKDM
ncbi:YidC/Oxa1 family membrane protein insertase [Breznakia sp. PF5-3]|uniref:YidC/Oxa1 family membrane protein insertase n=1 Tax=unclassified Breznakia TaxID=2623764 RepID=UPI002407762C|nr:MULTISPECIES: membrane protein insertase YidC [unclassified Breznakia]MDL2276022.1 membrane protein insertase YidC [Breznakia sp. OttesenSCG-928-G09]MDF9824335.1 YidC/Oxa1 family membrane protein insertase [Breznakia sp. PM6-1]MDF9835074.1 YidC/Oxa1 family membrane protein insertase [Breznakia sp. PF5-3]MDF9837755.1 YidC/Oxa1 family membrane protein insertase [Breznakia sp. PFB2-8]MDF9859634.1 YidC/Oxa1 family membrane protein insertase [Breznakia sp. PH5-24]